MFGLVMIAVQAAFAFLPGRETWRPLLSKVGAYSKEIDPAPQPNPRGPPQDLLCLLTSVLGVHNLAHWYLDALIGV